MEPLVTQIKATTYTISDVYRRLATWQQVLESTFYRAESDGSLLDTYVHTLARITNESDRRALTAWGTKWLSLLANDTLHARMDEVRTKLLAEPVLLLYVPVAFDEASTVKLGSWCRAELHPDIFLDLQVDPAVVGGCAFVHNDHYYDYSFSAQLREKPAVWKELFANYV